MEIYDVLINVNIDNVSCKYVCLDKVQQSNLVHSCEVRPIKVLLWLKVLYEAYRSKHVCNMQDMNAAAFSNIYWSNM